MAKDKEKKEYPVSREKNPIGKKADVTKKDRYIEDWGGSELPSPKDNPYTPFNKKNVDIPVVDTPTVGKFDINQRRRDRFQAGQAETYRNGWEDFFIEKLNEKRREERNGTGNKK